jgi:hypothetical protein
MYFLAKRRLGETVRGVLRCVFGIVFDVRQKASSVTSRPSPANRCNDANEA